MENKKLTTKELLKKLKISDFSQISGGTTLIKFADLLPKADPEVIKKALEQIPEFSKNCVAMVEHYKDVANNGLEMAKSSSDSFNASCDLVISYITEAAKDGNLSLEGKGFLIDKMIEVLKLKAEKDTENKKFVIAFASGVGATIVGIVATIISISNGNNNGNGNNNTKVA